MVSLGHLVLFVLAYAAAALIPGAGQAGVVSRALTRGARGATPFAAGLVLGNLLWLGAAIFGLFALARGFGLLFTAFRWAAAAYLIYTAVILWRSAGLAGTTGPAPPSHLGRGVTAGIGLALSNPKAVAFFGSILPAAIDPSRVTLIGAVELLIVGAIVDGLVQTGYVVATVRAGGLVRSPVVMKRLKRTSAAVTAVCGVLVTARS